MKKRKDKFQRKQKGLIANLKIIQEKRIVQNKVKNVNNRNQLRNDFSLLFLSYFSRAIL